MGKQEGELILVINPGSTSTKVAVFDGDVVVSQATLPLPKRGTGSGLWEELPDRLLTIREWLDGERLLVRNLDAVVARGGLSARWREERMR